MYKTRDLLNIMYSRESIRSSNRKRVNDILVRKINHDEVILERIELFSKSFYRI